MHFKLKHMHLDSFYDLLVDLSKEERRGEGYEIGVLQHGLGLKLHGKQETVTLYFYPSHSKSEVNVMKNGMRYIYPRRSIRMRKHTLCDLIDFLKKDERLFGCVPMIQWYINEIVKNDYYRYVTREQLS